MRLKENTLKTLYHGRVNRDNSGMVYGVLNLKYAVLKCLLR